MAFFLVDKPRGLTSFDVVHVLRKKLGIKKVGHTGTLDPLATGLMIIATGVSTKLIQYCDTHDKTYEAEIRLDGISVTDDLEGPIGSLPSGHTIPTHDEIVSLIRSSFSGEISQIPPQYSALKIDGKRAYARARSGETVEMKPRDVTIYSTEILDYHFPTLRINVRVSAGTYIRSIAHSLGEMTTGGGYLSSLRRTSISHIPITHPKVITDIQNVDDSMRVSYADIFPDISYIKGLNVDDTQNLYLGRKTVTVSNTKEGLYFLKYENSLGLIRVDESGAIRVIKNNV